MIDRVIFSQKLKQLTIATSFVFFSYTSTVMAQGETAPIELPQDNIGLADVVSITIQNSPNIMLQALSVEMAKAAEQIQTGFFDLNTNASITGQHQRKPSPPSLAGRSDQDIIALSAGLSKLFRSGVSANFAVNVNRVDIVSTSTNPELDASSLIPILNQSGVKFTVNIPLLKGAGEVSAGAGEKAAMLQSQAAEMEYQHFIANTLVNSISAYWEYKAALENLDIQQKAEARVTKWYNDVENLLKSSGQEEQLRKEYSTESSRLDAYLANKKRRTIEAKEQVNSTRLALANTIGVPIELADKIGFPNAAFPTGGWNDVLATIDRQAMSQKLLNSALFNRLDLRAAQLSLEAEAVKQEKARKDLNPTLNLALSAGYNGFETGNDLSAYADSLNTRVRGADTSAGLIFNHFIGNNVAKGQLALANASYQRSLLQLNELKRNIGLQVDGTLGKVIQRLSEVSSAQKAVDSYAQTLSTLATTTSLSQDPLIIFKWTDGEDKLNEAFDQLVQTLTDLSKQIVQLHFQAGTLIDAGTDSSVGEINLNNITMLPQ